MGLPPPPGAPRPDQVDPLGPDDVRPILIDVPPAVQSDAIEADGGAIADLAIWVDEAAPSRSLVIVAQAAGLTLVGLDGRRVGEAVPIAAGAIDIRPGVARGGDRFDLVAAGARADPMVRFFTLDRESRGLREAGSAGTGLDGVVSLALWHERGGALACFVADGAGTVVHLELDAGADEQGRAVASGRPLRRWDANGPVSGLVVDDQAGVLFVAEAGRGLVRYAAAPHGSPRGALVDRVGGARLGETLEGVAILRTGPESGYLIAAGSGGCLAIYERAGLNPYVCSLRIAGRPGGAGEAGETGLAAPWRVEAASGLSGLWASGLLAVSDGAGLSLVRWIDLVDRSGLPIRTGAGVR